MKRKKNYLLFIMGNFNGTPTVQNDVTDIIHTLTMVLTDSTLRYIHHDNTMVCHFQSLDNIEEIDWLLSNSFNKSVVGYFLIPKPRQMGIQLDNDLKEHLMDLKSKPTLGDKSVESKVGDDFKHISELFDNLKGDMEIVFKFPNNSSNQDPIIYSIDDILDKINEFGIDSLTKEEKEFLDEQSKK